MHAGDPASPGAACLVCRSSYFLHFEVSSKPPATGVPASPVENSPVKTSRWSNTTPQGSVETAQPRNSGRQAATRPASSAPVRFGIRAEMTEEAAAPARQARAISSSTAVPASLSGPSRVAPVEGAQFQLKPAPSAARRSQPVSRYPVPRTLSPATSPPAPSGEKRPAPPRSLRDNST